MSERISRQRLYQLQPAFVQHLVGLDNATANPAFPVLLLHLVKLRASQLNGCVFCQHLHAEEARQDGEQQQRLDVLAGWADLSGVFTAREQAALHWTEVITRLGSTGVSAADFAIVAAEFTEQEILDLTGQIITINSWNRIAVAFHLQPEFNNH